MAVNIFFMALMPISHAVAWYLVLSTQQDPVAFYQSIAAISSFYCAWALYKVFGQGDKKEKGHISMGLLCGSALVLQEYPYAILATNVLVLLNFAIVIPFFINRGVQGIVKLLHKEVNTLTMTWGYVFLTYLLGNVVLWSYTLKVQWGLANPVE